MDEGKLSRREKERLSHRRQMLEAALELFSQKGYHDVSMHEIAARAEFAIGTLYKFFKNKEDLYRALALEKAAEIYSALSEPLSRGGDPLTVLRGYLANRARIAADVAPLIKLHMTIAVGVSLNIVAEVEREMHRFHEEHILRLTELMEEGVRRGQLRGVDPLSLALALDGIARTLFFFAAGNPQRYEYDTVPELVLELFLKGGQAKRKTALSRVS